MMPLDESFDGMGIRIVVEDERSPTVADRRRPQARADRELVARLVGPAATAPGRTDLELEDRASFRLELPREVLQLTVLGIVRREFANPRLGRGEPVAPQVQARQRLLGLG